jgi:hypothetical protein
MVAAVIREMLEESAHHYLPRALLRVYHYQYRPNNVTYMRFGVTGEITGYDKQCALDAGIIRAVWLTPEKIRAGNDRHCSSRAASTIIRRAGALPT